MKIENKTFVVTGGGNGVGRALVLALLDKNARVAAIDINPSSLEKTAELAGPHAERLSLHVLDVTDRKAIEKLPAQVIAKHKSVTAIINNAGIIQPFQNLDTSDYDMIRRVFDINFFGTLYFTKAFLPYIADQPAGYIVNISSFGALSPVPGETIYGASKAAVKMMSEGLLMELKSTDIRVMTAIPGGINTDIIRNSSAEPDTDFEGLRSKLGFLLLTPEKAARRIVQGIESDRKRIVLGFDAIMIDILSRFYPRLAPQVIYQVINRVLHA